MYHRIASLLVLLCLAGQVGLAPVSSRAATPADIPPLTYHSPTPLAAPASLADDTPVTVMIELVEPPALRERTTEAIQQRRVQNDAVQARLVAFLQSRGVQVLFRSSLVYNGVAIQIAASQLPALGALDTVAAVHLLPPKLAVRATVPTASIASTWVAPQGATGDGVRIGVIDTGTDYTHAMFGGPGTVQAYATNDPTMIEPGSFPTAKVVGGYDFAGDDYDALGVVGSPVPNPDSDPLDCAGQGTAVAGEAAGYGETASGATFTGPYISPLDVTSFRIPPGVAPLAQLYALKIFGCEGASALLIPAIERALDPNGDGDIADRLDVLNISVGIPFGSVDDPDAVAVAAAVQAGMTVVASAGDLDGTFYVLNSPASAGGAIAVGASDAEGNVLASSSRGPQRGNAALKPDVLAPGVGIVAAQVGSGDAATSVSGGAIATAQVAGAAALLRQLHPSWAATQIKAALVGTATPVQAQDTAAPPSLQGGGRLNLLGLAGLTVLGYARETGGGLAFGAPWVPEPTTLTRQLTLENLSSSQRTVTLTVTTAVTENGVTLEVPSAVIIPPESSIDVPINAAIDPSALDYTAGPATPLLQNGLPRHYLAEHGGALQITASAGTRIRPGHKADIPPIAVYLDNELIASYINKDEILSYVPVAAGMRTLRVLRASDPPTAKPIITATLDLQPDTDYTVLTVGREKVFGVDVVVDTPQSPPSNTGLIHFTNANLAVDANSGPFDVYLDNQLVVSALAASATSDYQPITAGQHTVTFYPTGKSPTSSNLNAIEQITVAAGDLFLVGTDQEGDDYFCKPDDRVCKANQRGFSAISSFVGPRIALQVPFNVFPKSASAAEAASAAVVPPGASAFTLPLQNSGARDAAPDSGFAGPQVPLVSAFELEATSEPIAGLAGERRAADIRYVGVTSNISLTGSIDNANTALFFGTASYAPWSTPHEVQIRFYIDTNLDGIDDYVVLNTDYGTLFKTQPTDIFFNAVYQIQPDGSLLAYDFAPLDSLPAPQAANGFDVAPFNSSVMFQTVGAGSLGLSAGQTRFRYHVETRARDGELFGQVIDRVPATGSLEYDIMRAAVAPVNAEGTLRFRPLFVDTNGFSVSGAVVPDLLRERQPSVLLLHHHNLPAAQAEVVPLQFDTALPFVNYFPMALN